LKEAGFVALFIVLAIAMTWPLAAHLDRAISDPGDPYFTTWTLDWDYHATTHRLPLFQANVFHPSRYALAFSEHMYGIALLCFPLFLAGVAPLTIHNIAMLAGFATCGYAAFLLVRRVTSSAYAGVIGGIVYAFIGLRFHHLPHLHFVWSFWLPLVLLATIVFAERQTVRTASFLGAMLVMNGLTTLHWWAFGTFAAAVTLAGLGIAWHRRNARYWLLALGVLAAANVVLLPWLLPYVTVARLYGMQRHVADVLPNSGAWSDWLRPNVQSRLYGAYSAMAAYEHERTLFPGFVTIALVLIALRLNVVCVALALLACAGEVLGFGASVPLLLLVACVVVRVAIFGAEVPRIPARHGAAIGWIVIGAWGARGLSGALHATLFRYVAAFRGIRMPARWAMVSYVGIAVLAGAGLLVLIRDRSRAVRLSVTCLVAAALLFELRAAPIRWYMAPVEPRPLYSWLATADLHGAVLELPLTQDAAYEYLWRATVHHRPLINGVSSYLPPEYERLVSLYESEVIPDELLSRLEQMRCGVIVVHAGWLRGRSAAVRDWLRRGVASGRLLFLRRFDAGTRADYVFAIRAVEPHGTAPSPDAQIFLRDDGVTYCAQPFASIDVMPGSIVHGAVEVSGWALAPAGVKDVLLHFGNGRRTLHAVRFARPDVHALWPWYPRDPLPGFAAKVDTPFRGMTGDADLQLELIDGNGRHRLLPPFFFTWYPPLKGEPVWNREPLDALLRRIGVDAAAVRPRLEQRTAAIQDFIPLLMSGSENETDLAFVSRITTTLLGHPAEPSPYLALLANNVSRERVIGRMLQSREFADMYLRSGRIVLDR
jgi:hypothetical protein